MFQSSEHTFRDLERTFQVLKYKKNSQEDYDGDYLVAVISP